MTNQERAELVERLKATVGKAPAGWLYFRTLPRAEDIEAICRLVPPNTSEQQL